MISWEILCLAAIALFVFIYNGKISANKFFEETAPYLKKLKEPDYDFLVRAKYGDGTDSDALFTKRVRNGILVIGAILIIFITNMSYVFVLISVAIGFFVFKMDYMSLKSYYKKHLHQIDSLLPYYLKGLEILIQHYTVPVAIGRSITDAPPIFKEGLQNMIDEINAGNSSIDPYMDFAKMYPVRDSMRMMRLLYRLSLGRQERKQEQLVTFSKSISALQQKAREARYKARLEKMESKTMSMLIATGLGVMILLVVSIVMMVNI